MLAPPSTTPSERAAARHQRLDELSDMGMAFARAVCAGGTAKAETVPQASPDEAAITANTLASLALTYERVARTIRRNTRLDEHLDRPGLDRAASLAAVRRRVIRKVEDAIRRDDRLGPETKKSRSLELLERLEGLDAEADLLHTPPDTLVENLCHDLEIGLLPGMKSLRRTPGDIARLNARAAPEPSPPAAEPASPATHPNPPPASARLTPAELDRLLVGPDTG